MVTPPPPWVTSTSSTDTASPMTCFLGGVHSHAKTLGMASAANVFTQPPSKPSTHLHTANTLQILSGNTTLMCLVKAFILHSDPTANEILRQGQELVARCPDVAHSLAVQDHMLFAVLPLDNRRTHAAELPAKSICKAEPTLSKGGVLCCYHGAGDISSWAEPDCSEKRKPSIQTHSLTANLKIAFEEDLHAWSLC